MHDSRLVVCTAPDAPVITDCYMNVDGLTIVSWLPSAESDERQVPGSEFFIDYNQVGKQKVVLEETSVMQCLPVELTTRRSPQSLTRAPFSQPLSG